MCEFCGSGPDCMVCGRGRSEPGSDRWILDTWAELPVPDLTPAPVVEAPGA